MKIELSKKEIEILIKCLDTAIMFYITHKWKIYSKKEKLEGDSLNKLKEKFCIAIMQKEEDNIKEGRPLKPERMDYMEKGASIGKAREYSRKEGNDDWVRR